MTWPVSPGAPDLSTFCYRIFVISHLKKQHNIFFNFLIKKHPEEVLLVTQQQQ